MAFRALFSFAAVFFIAGFARQSFAQELRPGTLVISPDLGCEVGAIEIYQANSNLLASYCSNDSLRSLLKIHFLHGEEFLPLRVADADSKSAVVQREFAPGLYKVRVYGSCSEFTVNNFAIEIPSSGPMTGNKLESQNRGEFHFALSGKFN